MHTFVLCAHAICSFGVHILFVTARVSYPRAATVAVQQGSPCRSRAHWGFTSAQVVSQGLTEGATSQHALQPSLRCHVAGMVAQSVSNRNTIALDVQFLAVSGFVA